MKKSVFKHRSTLVSYPSPPRPLLPLSIEQKEKQGVRAGFAGLAKSLAYCVQKHGRLGFDTRGTPTRLKQKRVKNSKVEFSEKAEKFVRRKGVREVGGKSGYVLSTQKSCRQFSQDRGSNRGPCSYLS